jgi:hypothetical protein
MRRYISFNVHLAGLLSIVVNLSGLCLVIKIDGAQL